MRGGKTEWERGSSPSDGARQPPTGLPAGALLSHDVPRGWLIRSLSSVRSCRTEGRAGPSSRVDASVHRAAALAVETAPGRPGKVRPRPKLPAAWARPLHDQMQCVCPEGPL